MLTGCWFNNCSFALRCVMLASSVQPLYRCLHLRKMASRLYHSGLMCRCGQLRTLVVALDDCPELWDVGDHHGLESFIARLPALASGAYRLRTLQLVLPLLDGMYVSRHIDLGPVWRGLEALSSLTSLALGWAFMQDEPAAHRSERSVWAIGLFAIGK